MVMELLLGASRDSDGFSTLPRASASFRAERPWAVTAWLWSSLALVVGMLLTVALSLEQRRRVEAEQGVEFEARAQRRYDALHAQLQACGLLARTVQALYMTSQDVTPREFDHIYLNLRPRERFPSLLALAYAEREFRAGGERFITTRVAPLLGNERVGVLHPPQHFLP